MSFRSLALAALLAVAAPAHAQTSPFDPLLLRLDGFLAADGSVALAAPEPGAIAIPGATPPAAPSPLRFGLAAPVRFLAEEGFDVVLVVRAAQPVVARDAEGNAFELALESDGEPVEGATRRVALDDPVLAPGATTQARALLQAPSATFAEGATIALVVRPLMPALAEGALALVVGPDGSALDVPALRVPSAADLRLQESALAELVVGKETFRPARTDAAVETLAIGHAAVGRAVPPVAFSASGTYVVLRGEEPPEEAAQHALLSRDARVAAAHEYRVGGTLARVHPGLAVVVPVARAPAVVECARNCPPQGFRMTIEAPPGAPDAVAGPSGVLIPPPRDTRGIPVSEDDEADGGERGAPLPGLVALAAMALAASRRR